MATLTFPDGQYVFWSLSKAGGQPATIRVKVGEHIFVRVANLKSDPATAGSEYAQLADDFDTLRHATAEEITEWVRSHPDAIDTPSHWPIPADRWRM